MECWVECSYRTLLKLILVAPLVVVLLVVLVVLLVLVLLVILLVVLVVVLLVVLVVVLMVVLTGDEYQIWGEACLSEREHQRILHPLLMLLVVAYLKFALSGFQLCFCLGWRKQWARLSHHPGDQ